jgi:hypothetical protein
MPYAELVHDSNSKSCNVWDTEPCNERKVRSLFQGTNSRERANLRYIYVAARLMQQWEDWGLHGKLLNFSAFPEIQKEIQEMKWPSVKVSFKAKRKQFHLNGCSHYLCSDAHNSLVLKALPGRRQNQMKISRTFIDVKYHRACENMDGGTWGGDDSRWETILDVGTLCLLASVSVI